MNENIIEMDMGFSQVGFYMANQNYFWLVKFKMWIFFSYKNDPFGLAFEKLKPIFFVTKNISRCWIGIY